MFQFIAISIFCMTVLSFNELYAQTTLRIAAIAHGGNFRYSSYFMKEEFERLNPNVDVQFIFLEDSKFKKNLNGMLKGNNNVDIAIWHTGERLNNFIDHDLVLPITDIWKTGKLDHQFIKPIKNKVMVGNQIYAIPITYYHWGIYYKKSLFKRLAITSPKNWFEFNKVIVKFKENGITPFYIGIKDPWPVGIWFEYLNIRLNGLDFHNEFVAGKISAESSNIKEVLKYWKALIDSDYFTIPYQDKNLADGFPLIYREQAAMVLAGNINGTFMSEDKLNEFGFFPFPNIKGGVENIPVLAMDILIISKSTKQQALAKKFLLYASNKDVQNEFINKLSRLPANKNSQVINTPLMRDIQNSLNQVDEMSFFYDREVEKQYGQESLEIWKGFMIKPDIEKAQNLMEQARLRYLARQKKVIH